MKVKDIRVYDRCMERQKSLCISPLGNRLYAIAKETLIEIETDEGTFHKCFMPGFVTNFRSGGLFVDRFVDQIGSTLEQQVLWLNHDADYTPCAWRNGEHPVSKELADDILLAGLEFLNVGYIKRESIYWSVRLFGRKAYEEDDELTEKNSTLFRAAWNTKASGR